MLDWWLKYLWKPTIVWGIAIIVFTCVCGIFKLTEFIICVDILSGMILVLIVLVSPIIISVFVDT